jgi:FlaA1/EpsC-like NDP-sugar epimerase
VGLRPGEKLSEELVGIDEQVDCSPVEKIVRLKAVPPRAPEALLRDIGTLGSLASRGQTAQLIDVLRHIVPTFERVRCWRAPRSDSQEERPVALRDYTGATTP